MYNIIWNIYLDVSLVLYIYMDVFVQHQKIEYKDVEASGEDKLRYIIRIWLNSIIAIRY